MAQKKKIDTNILTADQINNMGNGISGDPTVTNEEWLKQQGTDTGNGIIAYPETPEETEETDEADSKWSDAVRQAQAAYAPYKPVEDEYVMAEPKETDYVKDNDWFDTYFPTVSREDEQERQRKYEQAQRWGLFGNALAAIGNAVGAAQGLRPVQINEPKVPDLQAWKTQLNSDRAKRAAAEEQQKTRYATARNQWQTGKTSYARALNQWQQQVNSAARTIYNADMQNTRAAENNATRTAIADKSIAAKLAIENIKAQMKAAGKTGTSRTRGSKGSTSDSGVWDEALSWINSGKLSEEEVKSLQNCKSEKTARAIINKFNRFHKTNNTTATGSTGGNNGGTPKHPNKYSADVIQSAILSARKRSKK